MEQEKTPSARPRIAFGLVLVAAGVALFLDRAGLVEIGPLWHHWPLLLVVLGGIKASSGRAEEVLSGMWLAVVGGWLYVSFHHIWDLDFSTTWPFMLILWGVVHIAKPAIQQHLADK